MLFEDNTVGKTAIIEQKLDGAGKRSDAKLLAQLPNDAVMPEFSPDGAWVLLMELSGHPNRPDAILRVRASGGPPEQVPTTGTIEEFHCSISPRREMRSAPGRRQDGLRLLRARSGERHGQGTRPDALAAALPSRR